MYNNITEIIDFIDKNKEKYLYFLSKIEGFPSICDYSSYVLGAYLSEEFNIEPIYIEGDYEVNDNAHCWLEIDNVIIDFTAYQFISEEKIDIKNKTEEEIYKEIIIANNLAVIITEEDELYDEYLYLGAYDIDEQYLKCARESVDFEDYLKEILIIINNQI